MSDDMPAAGIQISALMRAYLNRAGIPWAECEALGKEFDQQIFDQDWLSTDNGTTFYHRGFDPITGTRGN